jgi:hypothetical protein
MTTEMCRDKARTTLPRASDLACVAVRERDAWRDERGRLLPGNQLGRGRGWLMAVRRMVGRAEGDDVAVAVANDAWRLFCASMREMPSDGPTVRSLVAMRCRHEALAAFWCARSAELGLATPEGIQAQEQATKHGQRAERLCVTALDVASKMAARRPDKPLDLGALLAASPVEPGQGMAGQGKGSPEPTSGQGEGSQ